MPSPAGILRADARQLPLADESIDLIITSPPYWALRAYQDGGHYMDGQIGQEATPLMFIQQLRLATKEMVRVLKPRGSLFVNLGDKYAGSTGHNNATLGPSRKSTLQNPHYGRKEGELRRDAPTRYNMATDGVRFKSLMGIPWRYALMCIDDLSLILRAEIIWSKNNGMPESVLDRVRRSHEQVFHFVKQGSYHADMDQIREPYAEGTATRYRAGYKANKRATSGNHHNGPFRSLAVDTGPDQPNPLGKLPPSVWQISTDGLDIPDHAEMPEHYAAFPPVLVRRMILGWSPVGGTVLDPFGGSGTVAGEAHRLGRNGISADLSADYCRLARYRIEGEFAQMPLL